MGESGSGFLPTPPYQVGLDRVPIYFLGGVQLLCIGIIGEYLAKTYIEVKGRPRFFIERVLARSCTRPSARRARVNRRTFEDDAPAAADPLGRSPIALVGARRCPTQLDPRWATSVQALGNPADRAVFQRFVTLLAQDQECARSARDPPDRIQSRFHFVSFVTGRGSYAIVLQRVASKLPPVAYVTHGIEAAWSYAVLEDLPIGAHLTSPRRGYLHHGVMRATAR